MSPTVTDPVVLLLAAGEGDRLGVEKPFVDLGGRPMIERTLEAYLQARHTGDILLIVGPGKAALFEAYRSLRVHVIENPAPQKGMIASIRVGLRSSWAHQRNFLLAPVDVPFVKSALIDRLVATLIARDCRIVIPAYRGLGGHPGLFESTIHEDFFLHGDQQGTREILLRHRADTVRLNVPDCDVCFDVDTPEDLAMAMDPGARWARVDEEAEGKRLGPRHGR